MAGERWRRLLHGLGKYVKQQMLLLALLNVMTRGPGYYGAGPGGPILGGGAGGGRWWW